jgi:hypothetical protein
MLSDEAFELADRHDVDEFRLRPILRLAPEVQAEMVQHILRFNLTGRQVEEICEKGLGDSNKASETTPPQVRRFVKSMKRIDDNDEAEFLQGLLTEEKTVTMARARIDTTIAFLQRVKNQLPAE